MTNVETATAELITWKQVCKECGGDNITAFAVVCRKTARPFTTQYCYDCEENVEVEEVEEPEHIGGSRGSILRLAKKLGGEVVEYKISPVSKVVS